MGYDTYSWPSRVLLRREQPHVTKPDKTKKEPKSFSSAQNTNFESLFSCKFINQIDERYSVRGSSFSMPTSCVDASLFMRERGVSYGEFSQICRCCMLAGDRHIFKCVCKPLRLLCLSALGILIVKCNSAIINQQVIHHHTLSWVWTEWISLISEALQGQGQNELFCALRLSGGTMLTRYFGRFVLNFWIWGRVSNVRIVV